MATDPDDSRIGEYLSVLLAELLDPKASNAGTASVEEGQALPETIRCLGGG